MSSSPHVINVDQTTFERDVVQRSHDVPVVVDFWAAWCGPCRTLGPMLEDAVDGRSGQVLLAKVDVDANPALAQAFRVQGIPAVKAFRDGQVVDQFVGAVPQQQITAFLDRLTPTEADACVKRAQVALDGGHPELARDELERALELEPGHRDAAIALGGLLSTEDPDRALVLVRPHRPHPDAEAVAAQSEIARAGGGDAEALRQQVRETPQDAEARLALGRMLAAEGAYEEAAEHLLEAVRNGDGARDPAREQLVAMFTALGDDHPVVRATRPRLAAALF